MTEVAGFYPEERLLRPSPAEPGIFDELNRASGGPLELWLAGTGTPKVMVGRTGPCTVLRSGDQVMVIDTGNGCAYQLARLGIDPISVTHVFITHHHIDHNVDLGYLLISPWITSRGRKPPPLVLGPPGTMAYVDRVLAAYEYDLKVRIPHGYDPASVAPSVIEFRDGDVIPGSAWQATAIRVDHHPVDHAYGFRFDGEDRSLAVSGDTSPNGNLIERARGVDVLVHECIYPGFGFSEYHTLSTQVGEVAAQAEAKSLALTHLIPGHLPDEPWLEDVTAAYKGPAIVGQDLMPL